MGNCCVPAKSEPQMETFNRSVLRSSTRETKNFKLAPADFVKLNMQSVFEEYTFGETLGSGSFGSVYSAVHKATNSERAVKMVYIGESTDTEMEKLLKEVTILKALDHPNIIRIYEVFKNKNKLYLVTELCRGGELFERIQSMKRFGENQAAKYMLDIVSAVMHCHDNEIVHRDLKPENVLFESSATDAKLKLIDFGTSRFVKQDKRLKKAIGTCYYIAPEVLTGDYDRKVDVWSLGVVLYIMLSGHLPFAGRTDEEIFAKIKAAPLTFTQPAWHSVSEEAKFLIRKMLEKNPKNRYSIEDVFNDNWLQTRGLSRVPDRQFEGSTLLELAGFRTQSKLQKAVSVYIISQFVENSHFEQLRDVFMHIDKNGDGFLSIEEVKQAAERFEFMINPDEVIKMCDVDKNGYINYSEFLAATVNRSTAYSRKNLQNAFRRFDRNGDGKIDLGELKEALGTQNCDTMFQLMIEEADLNGDGVIDFDEFVQHMIKLSEG
jgi:calcium-dependent protein kinase